MVEGPDATAGKYLSEAQLKKLLQYVKDKADSARQKGNTRAVFDELIILLLVDTGLRAGELCNLNIADLPTSHGQNAVRVRDADGNVTRAVDISPRTTMCLERFVSLYRKGAKPNEPLLISERRKRLIYMSLYSKLRNIGRKAGIGTLHPQILRRTYLITLYNREQDLRFVQTQAGHASPATTAMYAKPNQVPPSSQSDRQIKICEACGSPIEPAAAVKIDSGQILCPDCLNQLRNKT